MQTRKVFLSTLIVLFIGTTAASAQMAAIMARDEPAEGGGARSASGAQAYGGGGKTSSGSQGRGTAKAKSIRTTSRTSKPASPATPRPWDGFVIGDKYTFMNFEVVSAEKPWHTREAKANGANGLVQVEILIDTNGKVIEAKARTGNKLLHPEAERAALASVLNKPTFGGKPARAIGFLVYRFGAADDDD